MRKSNSISDVPGILVGQAQDLQAMTGCTVILCKKGAIGGVDQRGGAPGTRETDLLRPMHLVERVHAVVLSGGSAFGLDAASGVMRWLDEHKIGFQTAEIKVPIVSAAVIYDLGLGNSKVRPDSEMGYKACQGASEKPPKQGNFGAGSGASVGKLYGMRWAMKSGIGSASCDVGNGVIVGAIFVVNAFGDVIDPDTNSILAGARSINPNKEHPFFVNTLMQMKSFVGKQVVNLASMQNTVIGVVATNAKLSKEEVNKVAQMAQDGIARTIRPAHTMFDGDTIFALSTGRQPGNVNVIGAFAAEMTAQAILSAVKEATSFSTFPSASAVINLQKTGGEK
jgi:L-aminopeptidase/D-esterase-like protein